MTIGSWLCGFDRIIKETAMIIEPINTNSRFLRLILKHISSFYMVSLTFAWFLSYKDFCSYYSSESLENHKPAPFKNWSLWRWLAVHTTIWKNKVFLWLVVLYPRCTKTLFVTWWLMRRRQNIFPKQKEETFTYALLLARVNLRKIPPNTAINIPKYVFIHSKRETGDN